jgi:hypothetical protein
MKYCDCACKLWCGDGPCVLLQIMFLLISCILTSDGCLPPLQYGRTEFHSCTTAVSYDVFSVKSLLLWLIFICDIFIIIFLKISNNMHHTLNESKFLTQSFPIPTSFGGGHHHHQGIHLVSQNATVKTNCLVVHSQ